MAIGYLWKTGSGRAVIAYDQWSSVLCRENGQRREAITQNNELALDFFVVAFGELKIEIQVQLVTAGTGQLGNSRSYTYLGITTGFYFNLWVNATRWKEMKSILFNTAEESCIFADDQQKETQAQYYVGYFFHNFSSVILLQYKLRGRTLSSSLSMSYTL